MKNTVQLSLFPRFSRSNRYFWVGISTLMLLGLGGSPAAAEPAAGKSSPTAALQRASDSVDGAAEAAIVPRNLPVEEVDAAPSPSGVIPVNAPHSTAETPSDTLEDAASVADTDTESWRVQRSTRPPIQVRRAVQQVRMSAEQIALRIAGDDTLPEPPAVAEDDASPTAPKALADGSDEAPEADKTRPVGQRVLTRFNPFKALGESIDFDKIGHIAGKILTTEGPQLVLAPYVRDPRWFEAMKLLKADQCDQAYDLATDVVGAPQPDADQAAVEPAIRYALARIEMCSSAHAARGKRTLEALAHGDFGTVSQLARIRLGLPTGRDSHEVDEGVHLRERIRQAVKLAANGKIDDALHDLETLRDQQTRGWYRYEIRSAEVQILERAGRLKEAAALMLQVYRTTRDWNIGDSVQARFEQLDRRAGTKLFAFGERVDRMRELIQRGQYGKARELSVENAKIRGVSGNEIRGWSLYRRAMEAEQRRNRKEAADLYAQADKLVKDPAIRPRIYFGWAKALRRLDRDPEAIALYDRICKEYARHTLCDDALFEAGRLSQYAENHEQARARFARVIEDYPESKKVPNALWGSAFSAYLMGDYAAMEAPLRQLIAEYPDMQDASELTLGLKAQYWLGVSRLKAGDLQGAEVALQATINQGPLTWYGRLAVARMKSAGMNPLVMIPHSEMSLADLKNLATLHVPDNPRLHLAAEYARIGLYADAIDALREQASVYPKPARVHEFLAAVYLANDDPSNAHWIMKGQIDQSEVNYRTLRDWGVAFPLNYMDLSHKYGTQYGVSPFLVQAIIRQESGFRPGVASYAGATGLMQLMPGTARYTQRAFLDNAGHLSRSEMVEPETNIRLGTMYIRVQTAFAHDRIPMALAGYNAGPAPLEDWFKRFGTRELDAWVESITYREARGYVRKVYTSYITYAGLYGGEAALPEIDLKMPEKLRTWGDIPEVNRVEEGEPISMLSIPAMK